MNRRFIHINVGLLSLRNGERYLDYFKAAGNVSIREKVDTWNKYAKSIKQHVFIVDEKEESYSA
jgi:hypothetical protein